MKVTDQEIQNFIDARSCDDPLFVLAKELQAYRRIIPQVKGALTIMVSQYPVLYTSNAIMKAEQTLALIDEVNK